SARPKSLNEVKESLSYAAKQPVRLMGNGANAGFKDIPRGQDCRLCWRNGGGGAKFVLMKFVHAARKPESESFIRTGHMTGGHGLFKTWGPFIRANDQ